MLRIGQRQYELVRAHSGFQVELFEPDFLKRTQDWRLEAHYVPTDGNPLRADSPLEYLRLNIHSEKYHLDNWRNLTGLGLDNDDDTWFGSADLENLLAGRFVHEEYTVVPGRLDLTMVGDYLFHCEFDGLLRRDGGEEDLEFEDDLPFAEVSLEVPINAADPVATARALAARAVGLTEISGSRVTPYDWRREKNKDARVENCHRVHLQTPWRHHMA